MDSNIYHIPVILDPRCLDIKFENNFKMPRDKLSKDGWECFSKHYKAYFNKKQVNRFKESQISYDHTGEKDIKYKTKRIIYEELFDDGSNHHILANEMLSENNEFDLYVSGIKNYRDIRRKQETDYSYWNHLEHTFPSLSLMAKDFLGIQACQAASERLVSSSFFW